MRTIGNRILILKGFSFNIEDIVLVSPIGDIQNIPNFIQRQFNVYLKHDITLLISQTIPLEESKEEPNNFRVNLLYDIISYRNTQPDSYEDLDELEIRVIKR